MNDYWKGKESGVIFGKNKKRRGRGDGLYAIQRGVGKSSRQIMHSIRVDGKGVC